MNESNFNKNKLLDLTTTSDVLPFCVYYWVNPQENIYRSYLSGPSLVKDKDGKLDYQCIKSNSLMPYGNWTLAFTFYAINPMIRPIPLGMSLFCAERKNSFPWDTQNISTVYDPYDIDENCVYFIAYTRPTPWTKPLFVHTQGNLTIPQGIFTSWNPNPPIENSNGKYVSVKNNLFSTQTTYEWVGNSSSNKSRKDNIAFPFYGLIRDIYGKEYESIKFICHNTYCFPYNPNSTYVQDVSLNLTNNYVPMKLSECVIKCNQLIYEEIGISRPYNLLSMIKESTNRMSKESTNRMSKESTNRIFKISPVFILLLITIFVASLSILVYLSIRKK